MKRRWIFLSLIFCLLGCSHPHYAHPHVIFETGFGDIEAELYPDKAPKSVAAFISYCDSGYYSNATFYRVLKDDNMPTDFTSGLIQGGVWPADKKVPGIPHEPTSRTGLSHTDGVLSLARTAPGTAGTEFFICIGDKRNLDAGASGTADSLGYAAFGKVIKGMNVVRKIQQADARGDHFLQPVPIRKVKVLQ